MSDDTLEEWRPVAGADGYEVSNLGRVRTCVWRGKRREAPRPCDVRFSYRENHGASSIVCIAGKARSVPRLVAAAFIGSVDGMLVMHRSGDLSDNRVTNLYLVRKHKNA